MLLIAFSALAMGHTLPSYSMFQGNRPAGQLVGVGDKSKDFVDCPLKHTSVNAQISGFAARVDVVQTFSNDSDTPLEAIYTFPLPHDAAIDRMQIKVGSKVMEGSIRRRDEARRIYDAAKRAGQTAALLDQERPNVFTQSVANITPGAEIQVDISYVQILKYNTGQFEFAFPMVVGPRYTGNTRDADKISPPIRGEGTRHAPKIDLNVNLDAGAPIQNLESTLHKISIVRQDESHALVSLANKSEVPNRDFILHYQTATKSVQSAFVTCYNRQEGGFFDLILLPPKQPRPEDIAPREMIFVMDQSGSQSGFPIEKSKELMFKLLKTMRPNDTFNVFGFNTEVKSLWPTPRPNSPENLIQAHGFVDNMDANGGTNILEGMRAALSIPKDPRRLRVVLLNTDGYVGNESDILREIQADRDQTRIFTFGIGNSVNRYLIDAMSLEGKGDSEMVTLNASASEAADRFVNRLRSPILTDVEAKVNGVQVQDVLPRELPDVFDDRPIIVQGRYRTPGHGTITISGRIGGEPWSKTLDLNFSSKIGTSCVSTLWARKKVDDLKEESFASEYLPRTPRGTDYKSMIEDVALQFGIMTEYTSFVAVEPRVVNVGGKQYTVHIPVQQAQGVGANGTRLVGGQGLVGDSIDFISFDSTDNSLVVAGNEGRLGGSIGGGGLGGGGLGGGGFAGGGRRSSAESTGLTRRIKDPNRYNTVVDRRLRSETGTQAVMIYLNRIDADTILDLGNLGAGVEISDKKLLIVFATCSPAALRRIAEMASVDRITPIE